MKRLLIEWMWTAIVFSGIWAVLVFWIALPEDEDGEEANSPDR